MIKSGGFPRIPIETETTLEYKPIDHYNHNVCKQFPNNIVFDLVVKLEKTLIFIPSIILMIHCYESVGKLGFVRFLSFIRPQRAYGYTTISLLNSCQVISKLNKQKHHK